MISHVAKDNCLNPKTNKNRNNYIMTPEELLSRYNRRKNNLNLFVNDYHTS